VTSTVSNISNTHTLTSTASNISNTHTLTSTASNISNTHTLPAEIALCCMADYMLLHAGSHDDHHHSDQLDNPGSDNRGNHVTQNESSAGDSNYSSLTPTPALSHTQLQVPSPWLPVHCKTLISFTAYSNIRKIYTLYHVVNNALQYPEWFSHG